MVGFAGCMDASELHGRAVERILLKRFLGATSVTRASAEDDRRGIDYWVNLSSGKRVSVDLKWRAVDPIARGYGDDVALETWSVVERNVVGWSRDIGKWCDYVLWFWAPTGRHWLVPFPMLCGAMVENWEAWSDKYPPKKQPTERGATVWTSEVIFVPRSVVAQAIEKRTGAL